MSIAFWVCAGVTLVSSLVSAGFAVAGRRSASGDGRVPSEYALSRSIALVVISVAATLVGSNGFLAAAALAMIIVQGLDAVVGARARTD